jgi:hypothetical protein
MSEGALLKRDMGRSEIKREEPHVVANFLGFPEYF